MFVGRRRELTQLSASYEQARRGEAALACVEGPPGIGKTSLIQTFLAETAPSVVAAARGHDDESTLAFGVLAQLAPGTRAGSGVVLEELARLRPRSDPIVAGRMVLEGLAGLQSSGVVVLVVEDLHWVDRPSALALRFALRRLSGGDRVLALLSTRPDGWVEAAEGWRRLVDERGYLLRLGGLNLDELAEMMGSVTGRPVEPGAADRLWAHTGGNPLYARSVLEEVDVAELDGRVPPRVPRSLSGVFVGRLAQCGPEADALVSAAAVLGERCPLVQAVTVAGISDPAVALGAAVDAGLVLESSEPGWRAISFSHPLVRAAVYEDLGPTRRVELHRRAAAVVGGSGGLMHRVASVLGPDDELAAELEASAEGELASGMPGAAAEYFWRAAEFTADPAGREERMLAAFLIWLEADELHEIAARRQQLEALEPSRRRDLVRASLFLSEGRAAAARAALGSENAAGGDTAQGDEEADERTTLLMGIATLECDWPEALRLVEQVRLPRAATARHVSAIACAMAGQGLRALELLDGGESTSSPGGSPDPILVFAGAVVHLSLDDPAGAKALIDAATAGHSEISTIYDPVMRMLRAEACYGLGQLDEAIADAELSLSLARTLEQVSAVVDASAIAGWAAAARGDWPLAERMVHGAEVAVADGAATWYRLMAISARWALSVARDDVDAMLRAAVALDEVVTLPEPGVLPFGPILAEALWRAGRFDEARTRLDVYQRQAEEVGRVSALVSAAGVRGRLIADTEGPRAALGCFESVVRLASGLATPLIEGAFWLAYGEVLARARQREQAVDTLRRARRLFQKIGAEPSVERVDNVLRRWGSRPSRLPGGRQLTATESVVARLVASGLSNQEVADQLVISRKGVEYHLGNVFAKLDVHSRTRLAAALGTPADSPR